MKKKAAHSNFPGSKRNAWGHFMLSVLAGFSLDISQLFQIQLQQVNPPILVMLMWLPSKITRRQGFKGCAF